MYVGIDYLLELLYIIQNASLVLDRTMYQKKKKTTSNGTYKYEYVMNVIP